ncbi:hypothetical protein KSP39_PZI018936 [Platanthera zijinensis]|uniref:Retrotransposon gag domain-containing protein n=1 Tax=Platanthera zijinensis TaxID=2320716 RepID=A0AAP0B371_9ASPA
MSSGNGIETTESKNPLGGISRQDEPSWGSARAFSPRVLAKQVPVAGPGVQEKIILLSPAPSPAFGFGGEALRDLPGVRWDLPAEALGRSWDLSSQSRVKVLNFLIMVSELRPHEEVHLVFALRWVATKTLVDFEDQTHWARAGHYHRRLAELRSPTSGMASTGGVVAGKAKAVEDDVCGSYAQVLCTGAGKIWFEEGDVMKIMDEHKAREDVRFEDDTFMLAIHKALETMEVSLETKENSHGSKEYKCPELLAELHRPLDCCIRQWLYRHSLLVTCGFIIVNLRLGHLEDVRDTPTQHDDSLEDDPDVPPRYDQRPRDGQPPADRYYRDSHHRAPAPLAMRHLDPVRERPLPPRDEYRVPRRPQPDPRHRVPPPGYRDHRRDEYYPAGRRERGPPPARHDYTQDDYPEDYPDPRRGGYYLDITRRIRLDAPSFDGRLDPKAFCDWLLDMDHYFEWYDMSDVRCVRFAKMKLIGQAKMKERLKEKYLPASYRDQLFEQLQNLRQGTLTVAEYMARFDELIVMSDISEEPIATASRFKAGLRSDIQRELIPHRLETVDKIFQLSLEYEQYLRSSSTRQGHVAAQCPTRNLLVEEEEKGLEDEEEAPEEVKAEVEEGWESDIERSLEVGVIRRLLHTPRVDED